MFDENSLTLLHKIYLIAPGHKNPSACTTAITIHRNPGPEGEKVGEIYDFLLIGSCDR